MWHWLLAPMVLAVLPGAVSADTLGGDFVFPHVTYSNTINDDPSERTSVFHGHGAGGKFLGMGNLVVDLYYGPDRQGGHPIARFLGFQGGIAELGIPFHYNPLGNCTILCATILDDPDVQELGNRRYLVNFPVVVEVTDPLLGLGDGFTETWIALVVAGPKNVEDLFETNWKAPALPGFGLAGLGLAMLGIRRALRRRNELSE